MEACIRIFASIAVYRVFKLLAMHLLLVLLDADRHIAFAPIHLSHVRGGPLVGLDWHIAFLFLQALTCA